SRAVASLNTLCEYCLPFVKIGGKFIAMKSEKADEEIATAANAIKTLGGQLEEIKDIELTDGATRKLIVIKKVASTPSKYPRPSAQIAKQAL
ncbi:MAG: class I SAM-dependent methyltransferase, partial [Clostridia bacterium]|nr:class I SAM-dependent methyltransferase [Clostridia bacterium]